MIRVSKITPLVALISGTCLSAFAQSPPPELSHRAGTAVPISKLPRSVIAPDGELTLFADFNDHRSSEWGEGVVIYLVNRTDKRLGFRAQDDDIYVKLEAKDSDGEWERAQPHYSSDCGNSYFHVPSLYTGEYFVFLGHSPSVGEERDVRFHIYANSAYELHDEDTSGDLIPVDKIPKVPLEATSNMGRGRISLDEFSKTRADGFDLNVGRFKSVKNLALGTVELTCRANSTSTPSWVREHAIRDLGRFKREDCLSLLGRFINDGDAYESGAAEIALAKLAEDWPPAQQRCQELQFDEAIVKRLSEIGSVHGEPIPSSAIGESKDLLLHPNSHVRWAAVLVLARACKQSNEAWQTLRNIHNEPNANVQSFVEMILDPDYGWCPKDGPLQKNP